MRPNGERRQRRRPMAEINVVPYIDVMLVLLVVFMVTAPMLYQGVKLDLPQVDSEPMAEEEAEPLIVSLDADGQVYLSTAEDSESPLSREALRARIAEIVREEPERRVLLRGDEAVAYGEVVALMAELREAGVPSVGLMSRPDEGNPASEAG
ncbi:MAG: protein TolR [Halorhodospira sp.]